MGQYAIRSNLPGEVLRPKPMALNSAIVGDWKSLLSNLGGTGPVAVLGWSDCALVLVLMLVMVLVDHTRSQGGFEGFDRTPLFSDRKYIPIDKRPHPSL